MKIMIKNIPKIKKFQQKLKKYSSQKRREINERFFKTRPGEYGEGDIFLGVRVPDIRKVAKEFIDLNFEEIEKFLQSEIHEERLGALLILVEQNKLAIKIKNLEQQKKIVTFYLKSRNLQRVNSWDLVDLSAHHILGEGILNSIVKKEILDNLILSKNMWIRRVAIVSTFTFIKQGKINITLKLAKKLLPDQEDLINKAVGWMLRESWKVDNAKVEKFLIQNYHRLHRTTLRCVIEKMTQKKRQWFLRGVFKENPLQRISDIRQ